MSKQIKQIKIVIPDAGPINTFAAADLLDLFLAPKHATLVIIESVMIEIIPNAPKLADFLKVNAGRIEVVKTSVCLDDADKRLRGKEIGKGRGDLAVADFLIHYVDATVGNSPALIIYEDKKQDKKLARLHQNFKELGYNAHFITTTAYLRKLEAEGIIDSFEDTWKQIVVANGNLDS